MDAGASNEALALIPAEQRANERGLIVFGHGRAALAGAGLEATLALAATNAQFRTFLRTRGRIGNALDIELQGGISAPERDRAFRMRGTSAVRVFGHDLLTGSVDVSDQAFTMTGNFDLFPDTPLRVTGSMNGHISANELHADRRGEHRAGRLAGSFRAGDARPQRRDACQPLEWHARAFQRSCRWRAVPHRNRHC